MTLRRRPPHTSMKPYDKHLGIWRFGITLARRFLSVKLGSLTLLLVLPILALTFALVQRQSKELAAPRPRCRA